MSLMEGGDFDHISDKIAHTIVPLGVGRGGSNGPNRNLEGFGEIKKHSGLFREFFLSSDAMEINIKFENRNKSLA